MHNVLTNDGAVPCDCPLTEDHAAAFEDALVEPSDRFTGMADSPAEDVVDD